MQVSRDPFARQEVHKRQVPNQTGGCAWCGNTNQAGKLWQFRVETDGGRTYEDSRLFCSKTCRNDYNG